MREITYRQAISEALQEEMERDPAVFLMGEDIGLYGGAYGATRGLFDRFGPERVRDTPISENTLVGAAIGAAMTGMRPVVEIMYVDFLGLAMDQIANQAAKIRYMFGGKTTVPMVLRTEGGAGRTLGAHHSQSLEAWLLHVPGLKVVMPATPYDAKGLLKSAIRDDNPVVFIEHKMLYGSKGNVPDGDYLVPIGKAEVKRPGRHLTIFTYSRMLATSLKAAGRLAEEGFETEVVDLRTISPLDLDGIADSVRKTHRALIVHEACKTGGVGAEVAAWISENLFDELDAPVSRVAGADVPLPKAPNLEELAIPSEDSIVRAAREMLAYSGLLQKEALV
ncbi:MAG: alpha-ketoacid dehydrogenase subunit beta [Chloroflexota bacterium]|jgi:pyruvate/2-oxoglutarate/acetoin dehydrogenase E1 component